jgi:ERF superfamily
MADKTTTATTNKKTPQGGTGTASAMKKETEPAAQPVPQPTEPEQPGDESDTEAGPAKARLWDDVQPDTLVKAILYVRKRCPYILKTGEMSVQGKTVKYASEGDIINGVGDLMTQAGLVLVPHRVRIEFHEVYSSKSGGSMNRVSMVVTYKLAHVNGQEMDVEAAGEGTDPGDKASPKAMTGAHKYALRQIFNVETGMDPDRVSSDEMERAAPETARASTQRTTAGSNGQHQKKETKKEPTPEETVKAAAQAIARANDVKTLEHYRKLYRSRGLTKEQIAELDKKYAAKVTEIVLEDTKRRAEEEDRRTAEEEQQTAPATFPEDDGPPM